MRTPAPSPMMKPSRSLSNGRLARGGLVVARRQRPQRAEPADAHRRDRRLRAARDHRVGVAAPDDLERLADGVRRRRAGGARRQVRPLGAEPDRDLAGGEVDDGRGNEERRDLARAALEQRLVLALDRGEPADARRDEDADRRRVLGRDRQPRVVHRELRRRDGVLDEDVHLLDVFLVDELQRVEAPDLRRDLRGEPAGVELRDPRDAARPGQQRAPVRAGADAERRHQADAGDDDPPAQRASVGPAWVTSFLPFACASM